MRNIVIIGASGYAKVIIDILTRLNEYRIVGLIDVMEKIELQVLGYSVLGTEEILPDLHKKFEKLEGIIAIGDNWQRSVVVKKIQGIFPNFKFATVIDPTAIISKNIVIGKGVVIMPGVIVNNATSVGDFCILNTKSSLDHDSVMEDFSSLAPGVTVGGNVKIGHHTAISLGANVIQGMNIEEHTVIGAGAVVVSSIPAKTVAYGVPARVVRSRVENEKFLK